MNRYIYFIYVLIFQIFDLIPMSLEHRFIGFGCGRVPEEVIYILDFLIDRYCFKKMKIFVIKNKTHNTEHLYL